MCLSVDSPDDLLSLKNRLYCRFLQKIGAVPKKLCSPYCRKMQYPISSIEFLQDHGCMKKRSKLGLSLPCIELQWLNPGASYVSLQIADYMKWEKQELW